ncbi:MAG: SusC/RagA family TonB-linked outer membrane protein [Fermentimonas sp.]|jgi:TonB-linked SusC/RagA family outer membrane protein
MKSEIFILLSLVFAFSFSNVSSQNITISGNVKDSSGEPLIGVTVFVENAEIYGTVTDLDGNYILDNVPSDANIIFSYVGMRKLVEPVNSRKIINVELISETELLEEVVVVGYGIQKKATVTGAISSVDGNDLMMIPSINLTNRLTGKIPGLTTVQASSTPGFDDPSIRIRGVNTTGNNSPLIVVDGIAGRNLSRLDPNDIESITVLKDASAAIYGAQAANGVILITTKRGNVGKAEVSITFNQGFSSPTGLPEMADAYTYMSMVNENNNYFGMMPTYSEEIMDIYKNGTNKDPWLYPETDWYKEVYRNYSPEYYGNISVKGGSEAVKYFLSLGGNYQEGIHRNSGNNYSQINFRSNIDGNITKNIKIGFDLSGRQSITNRPADMYNPLYSHQLVVQSRPNMPARWPNGLPGPGVESDLNPVVSSSKEMGYDRFKTYYLQSLINIEINLPFITGLSFKGNISVDKTFNNNKKWSIPYYLYYWKGYNENNDPELIKVKHGVNQPELSQKMADYGSITLNALMNYDRKINNHSIGVLFGTERSTSDNMDLSASRKYFPSEAIDQLFAGGDLEKDNNGSASQSARLNYFGRLNYSFRSKYLAEFVFRYDGSYIFHKDYRFGFFPGISLGWVISEEEFWKRNVPFFNYFKLRGSWGQTGNDRIAPYQYLATYGFRTDWKNKYIFDKNVENTALRELRIPFEKITWEVANQSNIGLDMQMLEGRISANLEYFYNFRNNILEYRNASVPLSTGLTLPRENIGEVSNQGFEIMLSYHDRIGKLSFTISPNVSYATNKIVFWDETPNIEEYRKSTGKPIGAGLYYQAIGIFKDQAHLDLYPHLPSAKPGDIIFKDVNGDNKIDGLDQVRSNNSSIPKYFGGLNIDLRYNNFYTSIFLQGAAKNDYYLSLITGSPESNYFKFITEDRWTEENTDATNPRAAILARGGRVYWSEMSNTHFLKKGDYLRLKSIEFGYSLQNEITKKMGLKEVNIYFSGMNLLTLSNLPKGFDPERSSISNWPLNKVYNIGIKLTL